MAQKITARTLLRTEPGVINDTIVPGLRFMVAKRSRTFRISPRINGGQRNIKVATITAGNLKEAGEQLTDARERARKILEDADKGVDPVERERIRKLAAQKARQDTFEAVARLYMAEDGDMKMDAQERWRKLTKEIFPVLGDWPIRDITRAQIKEFLLAKYAVGPSAAEHLRGLTTRIFTYALDEGYIDASVAAGIRLPGRPKPRDHYLRASEIRTFWNGLDAASMIPQIKLILRFLLVTGQRSGEVVSMHWNEIDIENSRWEIPASRTKSGTAHRVHLTELAWSIIREAGTSEGHVFGKEDGTAPARATVSQAMLRNLEVLGLADRPARPHDLRRTMATHLGDLGIQPFVVSRLLNHALQGVTETHYLLSAYAEQRRQALESWSNKLQEITSGEPAPSKVPRLRVAQ
jgi:integrase